VLDLIVVDDDYGSPIGRPTITVAIDVATRMFVGFHISFQPPSIHSVIKCLRHAIMPKASALARFPEIKNTWDAYGVPETIVVDNGKEFHSRAVEEACRHLNIQIHHTPRKQPWQKPKVERLFGILNTEVLAGLPGRTFSNVKQKGEYKPEKSAIISFAALVKILNIWIVDHYNQTPRQGTLIAPAHAWIQSVKSFPPVPSSQDDLNFALCHIKNRTVHPTGIQLFGLKYQHEELSRLRRKKHGDFDVIVRYDTDDLGSIIVIDPDKATPIRVPAVEVEYATGLTVSQHVTIRDYLRRTTDKRVLALKLADVRKLVRLIIKLERQKERKGWTKRLAIFTGMDSENPDGREEFLDPVLLEIAGATSQDYEEVEITEDPEGKAFDDLIEDFDETSAKDDGNDA
jgi:putative transposase